MTEERFQQLENRVSILEQIAQGFEARMSKMERPGKLSNPVPPQFVPPPVQTAPPGPPKFDIPSGPSSPPPPSPIPPLSNSDAEYQFGAQWLPRIGASLVVLGISFLIALGVNRGWITPPVLFAGAMLLCVAFILVGLKIRDEKEDFGQVLMGIGSCGIFATFAGGHIYQNLYSGEVMVSAFVVWSLANLGYALWRSSRSFLAIGVIGGLLGAAMPVSKDAFSLSLGLHAAILAVSAVVIVRHRFGVATLGLWIASMLALLPIGLSNQVDWITKVASLEISTLVCVLAYILGRNVKDEITDRFMIGGLVGFAAIVAFGVQRGHEGSLHLLALAVVCGALAFVFRKERAICEAWAWTGIFVGAILAPLGLSRLEAAFVYSGLAIAGGTLAAASKKKEPLAIAFVSLIASGVMYSLTWFRLESSVESLLMGAVLLACATLGFALRRDQDDPRNLILFLIGWCAASRLSMVMIEPGSLAQASASITVGWMIYGVILLAVGFIANYRYYRFAAIAVLMTAVGKILLVDMATASPELRVTILIGVGLALVAGGYAYIRRRTSIS